MDNTIVNISFRNADINDVDLVYEWANDPVTRLQSFSTDTIPYETHVDWYRKKINSDNSIFLIVVLCDDSKVAVGSVRLDREQNGCKVPRYMISYQISKQYRGRHIGREVIRGLTDKELLGEFIVEKEFILEGEVKKDNYASINCFEKNDFIKNDLGDRFCYTKEIKF